MRISDIILESTEIKQAVIDLIAIMAAEDIHSIGIDVLQAELASSGYDIDEAALYDLLTTLVIVNKVEDGVAFFNTDSQAHDNNSADNKADDKDVVDKMARKQISKEL